MEYKVEREINIAKTPMEEYMEIIENDINNMNKDDIFALIIPATIALETTETIKSRYEDAYLEIEKVEQEESIFKIFIKNPDKVWDRYALRFKRYARNELHIVIKEECIDAFFKYAIIEGGKINGKTNIK